MFYIFYVKIDCFSFKKGLNIEKKKNHTEVTEFNRTWSNHINYNKIHGLDYKWLYECLPVYLPGCNCINI